MKIVDNPVVSGREVLLPKMRYFTHKRISDRVTRICDTAETKMYLVEGDEKAALIDTGSGVGNIYEYVRTLTEKPLIVILTHGHVDHGMGTGTFPQDIPVYMSPLDEQLYKSDSNLEKRKDYVKSQQILRGFKGLIYRPSESDWHRPRDFEKLLPLSVGDTFELGGENLIICHGQGHTKGCVTVLFEKEKSLLLGDAVNGSIFLFDDYCLPVSEFKKILIRLKEDTDGRYDRTYLCHGTGNGTMDLIDGAIFVCDKIMTGEDDHFRQVRMGKTCYSAKRITFPYKFHDLGDHSSANIMYREH